MRWKTDDVLNSGKLSNHKYDYYGNDTVASGRFAGLKVHFKLDEGTGGSFRDNAGGLIWTFDTDANTHSVENAVTFISASGEDESPANSSVSGNLPAPGVRQSILVVVFGATVDYNIAEEFTYFRFGATHAGDNGQFVLSMNSKPIAGNNCAKNWDSSSGPSVTWTPVTTASVHAIATVYSNGTLRNDYYVNTTKYTGTDHSARSMDKHGATIAMSATGTAVQSVYTIQYWIFDELPGDITSMLSWTKDAALAGNKDPYPGWAEVS